MTERTDGKGAFDALLDEMTELAKSAPAADADAGATEEDDAAIAAAAAEGEGEKKEGDEEGDAPMAKSFTLKLDDGTEVEAIDGAELVKSLIARVEKNEADTVSALGAAVKIIATQGDMLKSMGAQIAALGNAGKGRKAVLTIVEKPGATADLTKSEPTGMSGEAFLGKAMELAAAGKLTGRQVSIAEAHINMGQTPPAEIIRAVMAS